MKQKTYVAIAIVVILSILISGVAMAQLDSGGDEPRPECDREQYSSGRAQEVPEMDLAPRLPSVGGMALRSQQINAPQILLGEPGLNFRIDQIFGVNIEPYPVDTVHINGPRGLFIDAGNNVYVAEAEGSRILRYNNSGTNTLSIGTAGWWDASDENVSWPEDVHVDSTGDIWVVDASRVARFSSSGSHEMSFPADEDERYDCLTDNDHFCYPQGLAFDTLGRLYVSDTENHRIQVFTISGGTPVYWTTIGTGIAGTGNNQFNYPYHIALNSANELFVADSENHRVQKCTYSATWTCTTFHGVSGVWGDDANHLSWPRGITVDPSGNVFIADTDNWRVKKCTSGGSCSDFAYPRDPEDVALDSDGNVYTASWYNSYTINKYNSGGGFIGYFAGTFELAYVGDSTHIYTPHGIGIDPSGNIYVSERRGNRWLKINPNGTRVWSKGTPGMRVNNSQHFGNNLYGNPAVSADNLLYLPAGSQRCVKVYDLDGIYQSATIGTCHGSTGDDGTLLGNVAGVAISPLNARIYVVDRGNRKVKVYDSSRNYLGYIGQGLGSTGYGNGDYQFDEPMGIAVDKDGNIYVADRYNHRVQKYNSGGVFQYSIGETDWCDWDYDHLCAPSGVAVDRQNRVYIAENWNDRVSIYDSAGAYLTTIVGGWGTTIGKFNEPSGVAVALDGTVYVTEYYNHRVQVFKPGVLGWMQSNLNGFANPYRDWIWALEPFGNYLYASPTSTDNYAQLWRISDSTGWNQVEFGEPGMWLIADMVEFNNKLYAATYSETGAGIWRSDDGLVWNKVYAGNVNLDNYSGFWNLAIFNNAIYAASDYSSSHGTRIIKSSTGDMGSWNPATTDGFGVPTNLVVIASQVHNGCLYMGTWNNDGAQLWRTCNGTEWERVDNNSFGDTTNYDVSAIDSFNNKLYVSTGYNSDFTGAQLYSCVICDGSDWSHIVDNGMGNPHNNGRANLISLGGWLYWAIWNWNEEGMTVWRTKDGQNWQQIGFDGLGDVNNDGTAGDNTSAIYNDRLYIGTHNRENGGEIWVYLDNFIYLPIILR